MSKKNSFSFLVQYLNGNKHRPTNKFEGTGLKHYGYNFFPDSTCLQGANNVCCVNTTLCRGLSLIEARGICRRLHPMTLDSALFMYKMSEYTA